MQENLLDYHERPDEKRFFKKSRHLLLYALGVFIILISFQIFFVDNHRGIIYTVTQISYLTAGVISLIGIIYGIKSCFREKFTFYTLLVLAGHLLIFSPFVLLIAANIIDLLRYAGIL